MYHQCTFILHAATGKYNHFNHCLNLNTDLGDACEQIFMEREEYMGQDGRPLAG